MSWKGLPRAFWAIWVGTLVNKVCSLVISFLALYLTDARHLTIAQAGQIISLWGAGSMLAGPVGGVLADRFGRRLTMLIGLVGGSLAMISLGLSRSVSMIAGLSFVLGLVGELYRPAVSAMVADLVPAEDRQRAYGLLYWAVNIGFSIAPILGGLFAKTSFTTLFIADASTTLACAVIIYLYVPETLERRGPQATLAAQTAGLAEVFQDRVFVPFLILTFLLGGMFQQGLVSLPLDLRAHGIEPVTFGKIIAVNGVLIVLLQPLAGEWLGRFRRSRVLAAAAILTGIGFGLNALVHTAPFYAVAVGVWTLGEIASAPVGASIVADLAPADKRGRYQGAYGMAWGLSTFAGPSLGSMVLGNAGPTSLWTGCLFVGGVIAVGHIAIAGARRRRLAPDTAVAIRAKAGIPAA